MLWMAIVSHLFTGAGATELVVERRPVTLQEAVALAARSNFDVAAARASALQVAAKSRLVYSAALPEISLQGTYVRTSAEQKFDPSAFLDAFEGVIDTSIRGTAPAYGLPYAPNETVLTAIKSGFREAAADGLKPTTIVARDSVYGTLLLQQVLFTPQFLLIPSAAEAEESAKFGTLEAREQVLLGVARIYLGVEGLEQLERAAREAEQVALKREKDANAQIGVGSATELALLRAQSETAQARAMLATLTGQRVSLLAMLEALVGEAISPRAGAQTTLEVTPAHPNTQPWEQCYLVKSLTLAVSVQERFSAFDRISWLPSIVLQAKGSYNSNKGFANTNFMLDGIVAAQWTLYDRGQRSVQLHENDAKSVEIRARLESARRKGRATWIGAATSLDSATVALEQAEAQAQLATRAQKQVESAFHAGFSTALEVSDIDNKRFLAASAVAQTRAQLEIRKLEVVAAEGRLASFLGVPLE
jgi:outer membrane protein TolC